MNPYLTIPKAAIVTYTGRMIEPLNPDPAEIDILDIAHALSNQCRFTGHTSEFYSVAQHSVLVSRYCDPDDALWGLLHDASEAYLSDICRPVKRFTEWGEGYGDVEIELMRAVGDAFKLPDLKPDDFGLSMPASVKWADDVLLRTEMRDLMPEGVIETMDAGDTLDEELFGWAPERAKEEFLLRYKEITDAG
jgi:hypothetical protein